MYPNFYSEAVRPETPPQSSELLDFDHIRAVPPLITPNSWSTPKPSPKLSLSIDSVDVHRPNLRYRTNHTDNITKPILSSPKPLIRSLSESDTPTQFKLLQTFHPILDNLIHPRSPNLINSYESDIALPPIVHQKPNSNHLQSPASKHTMHRNDKVRNYTYAAMMTPQKFSNKDNSPTAIDFISKFDTLRKINRWDDETAAEHFHLFLTDGPSNWYRTLDEDTRTSYEALKEAFSQTFDADKNNSYNSMRLYNRHQKGDEKVEKYLSDLYKLFSNNENVGEEQKKIIFMKGLLPKI